MRSIKNIALTMSLVGLLGCKFDQKQAKENSMNELDTIASLPKTYAEISIAQGGEWKDGPRGHKEYADGTSFKNVEILNVPEEHTDHTWYLRYEGPGWESNKVGYRLYLDWRNAIDIFGKKTSENMLPFVGQDGFDSYHEMADWGMDILKVGKGLGIGSIGRFVNEEVLHFNNVENTSVNIENTQKVSSVEIFYKGWETNNETIDLNSQLSIEPNERLTKHTMNPSKLIDGICTGIVKHGVDYFAKVGENGKWGYIATYGEQSLVPDNLGMVVFYEVSSVEEVTEWEHDHLLIFKPTTEAVSFYFAGAWEKELDGISSKEEFLNYIDEVLINLDN